MGNELRCVCIERGVRWDDMRTGVGYIDAGGVRCVLQWGLGGEVSVEGGWVLFK